MSNLHSEFVDTVKTHLAVVEENNKISRESTDLKVKRDIFFKSLDTSFRLFKFLSENADTWFKKSPVIVEKKLKFFRTVQDKCNTFWYDVMRHTPETPQQRKLFKDMCFMIVKVNNIIRKYQPLHVPERNKRWHKFVNYYPDGLEDETFSYPDPLYVPTFVKKVVVEPVKPIVVVTKKEEPIKRESRPRKAKEGVKYA